MSKDYKLGLLLGLTVSIQITTVAYFESDKHISPEEYAYYDEHCLKAASTTKILSFDSDDAKLYCHNGAVFEFDNRKQFKEEKQ